ncbi:MAG: HEAT repeat domain-containing protein [Methanomicrobiales archaeon]
MTAIITDYLCNECGDCSEMCPAEAIYVQNKSVVINHYLCTDCGFCIDVCHSHAISIGILENPPPQEYYSQFGFEPDPFYESSRKPIEKDTPEEVRLVTYEPADIRPTTHVLSRWEKGAGGCGCGCDLGLSLLFLCNSAKDYIDILSPLSRSAYDAPGGVDEDEYTGQCIQDFFKNLKSLESDNEGNLPEYKLHILVTELNEHVCFATPGAMISNAGIAAEGTILTYLSNEDNRKMALAILRYYCYDEDLHKEGGPDIDTLEGRLQGKYTFDIPGDEDLIALSVNLYNQGAYEMVNPDEEDEADEEDEENYVDDFYLDDDDRYLSQLEKEFGDYQSSKFAKSMANFAKESPDNQIKLAYLCGLSADPSYIPKLEEGLDFYVYGPDESANSNVDTNTAVAWAYGKIKDKSAVPILLKLLKIKMFPVVSAAAWALTEIGDQSGFEDIKNSYDSDFYWDVVWQMGLGLGEGREDEMQWVLNKIGDDTESANMLEIAEQKLG